MRVLLVFLLLTVPSFAAKRVALVIGNSSYAESRLQNPSNDADDVASVLTMLEFQVTKLKDVTKQQFEDAVDKVTSGLGAGDACLIFYAGHGMQLAEENYLVPIGAAVDKPQHVKQRCVTVSYLLDALEFSDCSLKIVIVDACRNNPFRGFSRSTPGLADLREAPEGTIVSFSTSPRTAALDGAGGNSPYAKNLVTVLKTKAKDSHLVDLFLATSRSVARETGQRPFLRLDAAMPEYYLFGPNATPSMRPTPPVPRTIFANSVGLTMRRIDAGQFEMGSHESASSVAAAFPGEDAGDFANEHPLHTVRIRSPFYISTTEVTFDQFSRFVADSGYRTVAERGKLGDAATAVGVDRDATWRLPNGQTPNGNHPVTMITYHDADAFCRWLSVKEGKTYRLPTDEEWEYAARAGTRTRYWNGDDPRMLTQVANIPDGTLRRVSTEDYYTNPKNLGSTVTDTEDGFAGLAPVGSFPANPWGLHDVHGNVWEWCTVADVRTLRIADTQDVAVIRGGCFY